ncbi:MAG: galactose oxidase [Mucilaginibacter sp.]|nr:galactose oxidase [Mucilaginibacter sp.]
MKPFFHLIKPFFFFVIFFISCHKSYGQSYGLGFRSYEVIQDKRTSLDLSPGSTLCFNGNFELSFEISFFQPDYMYYGNILRIIENDERNIDIVYNTMKHRNAFSLIIGEQFSKIEIDIDRNTLYTQWSKLRIKFDTDNDRLIVYSGNKMFVEKSLHLKKRACYKILFGTNNYKEFQTTDVPPMKLRDIRISQNNELKYNWPLNEINGSVAHETVSQNNAAVINPIWMLSKHHDWQLAESLTVNGIASIGFNPQKGTLYIVGRDSLFNYSVSNAKWNNRALLSKLNLSPGNRSIYDKYNNDLYNFFIDNKLVNRFDFKTSTWDIKPANYGETTRLDVNSMISDIDTSLYFFGGYGHHLYKNDVSQFHLKSQTWQNINAKGDFFIPRYLSGLGSSLKGDTAYILGGYGDSSGQQILNPKNLYDMMRFTVKDKTFKRLFELNNKNEDFAFANSLVIDDKQKKYYALIFPQNRYKSNLQLITGSLTSPEYSIVGNSIPYNYHDTHSFADLYYDPQSKIFVAVTLLRSENNQTQVNIYTLLGPPYGQVPKYNLAIKSNAYLYGSIAILILLGASLFVYYKKRAAGTKLLAVQNSAIIKTEQRIENSSYDNIVFNNKEQFKNAILLFGDLQVFDAEGVEITKFFTPLIKELFLVILIYSLRWGRGLSSEKLNEILWSDKDAKSARNNRSVNIAKLKNLLDRMGYCHLSKNTGYWKIDIDFKHIHVDYNNYLNIVKEKGRLDIQKIKFLSVITQRGGFLSNIEYEWLDIFKSEISNEVIDTYLHFAHDKNATHDSDFLVELANFIFYFDPVNEDAMMIKCKALFSLGKHSLAKNTFDNFVKEYKVIYGEDFKTDFHAVLE